MTGTRICISYEELMYGLLPLRPIDIVQKAKQQLDAERQYLRFSDYRKEHAALRSIHVIAYLEGSK